MQMQSFRFSRLDFSLRLAAFCGLSLGAFAQSPSQTAQFRNPERVTIRGYSDHAMEPFLTRDGKYLMFNNLNEPSVNTNLHYAERVDDLTFEYRGEMQGVNTPALEGVATMDGDHNLFFVSPRNYPETLSTIYQGRFENGKVTGVGLVPGISRKEPGIVNFDVEVSPDGETLYFVDGRFTGGPVPQTADLIIAKRKGSVFERLPNSAEILSRVNTDLLEYAACISADGRELYFTRLDMSENPPRIAIYLARRAHGDKPFGEPEKLTAITGFVEAGTLSPDEKSLYYHKKEGERFVIYRVTR